MTFTIPAAAATGFRDGSKYDQARPSYPSEAVDSLLKYMQVDGLKGARIVDLGAGTGIFTKLLADRDEGFEIFAVEPHADMRAELVKKGLKGVKVVDGGASKMESVESQYVDAVVASQVCLLL
jgi:ubiquinone/menaquinone biosynthesis C-methylase UbiE